MSKQWDKLEGVDSSKWNMFPIPNLLKEYKLYNPSLNVAYMNNNFLNIFVHFKDNPIEDHVYESAKKICQKNVNGVYTNYVCFYSYTHDPKLLQLQQEHDNFSFYYLPLITYDEINNYLDIEKLPALNYNHTRKYACLMNRSTTNKRLIFDHLKNNDLLDSGYVSYRNNIRGSSSSTNIKRKDHQLQKPFINFEEEVDGKKDYTFIWVYPVDDFLFDFACETHNEEYVILTEKSTKGFVWGKIPVVFGGRNTMHYLEQLGFDIFRDIINYSYDIQKDQHVRIEMYLELLSHIVKIDINKIPNLKQRLNFNRNLFHRLTKLSQHSLSQINLNTEYLLQNRLEFLGY